MSTLTKEICDKIIKGHGHYPGDEYLPCVTRVVTYNNQFNGGLEYASIREDEDQERYHNSPACHNVQTYWTLKDGINKEWKNNNEVRKSDG